VRNGKFGWIAVPTNTFVNEFRIGWATDRQADTFNDKLLRPNLGYLAVTVNGQAIGSTYYLPRVEPNDQRLQFAGNATWTKGEHIVKFGFDTASAHDIDYYISNANGSYTYQNITNLALDYSNAGLATSNVGKHGQSYTQTFRNPVVDFKIRDYALYAQDQWRVTSRLNLMLAHAGSTTRFRSRRSSTRTIRKRAPSTRRRIISRRGWVCLTA
jgi:hypothetical protein